MTVVATVNFVFVKVIQSCVVDLTVSPAVKFGVQDLLLADLQKLLRVQRHLQLSVVWSTM